MAEKQLIERAEQALYKVYNRFPVVFDHGEGVYLYDSSIEAQKRISGFCGGNRRAGIWVS